MAGNHNSGRKTWDKEIQSKELWNLSIPVLKHALRSETIPEIKKAEIALSLFNKMAPTKLNLDGELNHYINMGRVLIDGKQLDVKID
jgi:hypothetical protein